MKLNELTIPKAATTRPTKRRGRGSASGQGGTAGRGHKGQRARSGKNVRIGFEGGQMPIIRRLPKKGFTNIFRVPYETVNLGDLEKRAFEGEITPEVLKNAGLVHKTLKVKILGDGEITKKLTVKAHAFSASAREKIINAGGTAEVV